MRLVVGTMGQWFLAAGLTVVLVCGLVVASDHAVADDGMPYESLKDMSRTAVPALAEAETNRQTPRRRPVEVLDGTGPTSANQCVWLGKRIINLLIRDDAMAANDFVPFYSRFECSETHLADAFGCLIANLGVVENGALADQIDDCWRDPAFREPPQAEETSDTTQGTDGTADETVPADDPAPAESSNPEDSAEPAEPATE